jgi:putative membrane protein
LIALDLSKAGVWAMILCWLSAIGGIALAILWASKPHPPVDDEILLKSLERRLKSGELNQAEYRKRLAQLRQGSAGRGRPAAPKTPPRHR